MSVRNCFAFKEQKVVMGSKCFPIDLSQGGRWGNWFNEDFVAVRSVSHRGGLYFSKLASDARHSHYGHPWLPNYNQWHLKQDLELLLYCISRTLVKSLCTITALQRAQQVWVSKKLMDGIQRKRRSVCKRAILLELETCFLHMLWQGRISAFLSPFGGQ